MKAGRRLALAGIAIAPFAIRAADSLPMGATRGLKRLGILGILSREVLLKWHAETLARRLDARGWTEGRTLAIEWRFAENDESRHAALARALVEARVDAIATWGTSATHAAQDATRTIPIVTGVSDPVGFGFAKSLARPGGNVTGLSFSMPEISRKEFELLRALLPGLSRLLVLTRATLASIRERASPVMAAAREAGVAMEFRQVSTLADVESALRALPKGGRAAVDFDYNLTGIPGVDDSTLAGLALRHGIPAIASVDAGGLMTYTLDFDDEDERYVAIIDRVLRGTDPAFIPFETPTRQSFNLNLRTAKALGIRVPADIRLRADRVIE